MHTHSALSDDRPAPASLSPLQGLVKADLERVNDLILSLVSQDVPLIEEIARHIIRSGGKRLRPALVIASAQLCGHEGERHIALAAAVEFLHTATLLHDDVVDESTLRRGDETANAIWSNQASVLVGDFLLSRAFQLMVRDGSLEVLKLLSDTSAIISQGEVMQMSAAGDLETTEAQYLQIIGAKTAALFSAATQIGPLVAARPASEVDALARFGESLGIAFQLADDALDYAASQAELGKMVGDDFRECKLTLPVILAYQAGNAQERTFWERAIGQGEQSEGDLAEAMRLIRLHGTLEKTMDTAYRHARDAVTQLEGFHPSPVRQALEEAALFSAERRF